MKYLKLIIAIPVGILAGIIVGLFALCAVVYHVVREALARADEIRGGE